MPKLTLLICMTLTLTLLSGCAGHPDLSGKTAAQAAQKTEQAALKATKEALNLAHMLRDNGRYKAAFEVYRKMDEQQTLKDAFLLEYATVASFVVKPEGVIPLYQQADKALAEHQTDEQREAICMGLGRAYLQMAQRKKATGYLDCVLAVNPHNVTALNGAAVLAGFRGQTGQARTYLETALDIDPDNTMVLNNLAMTYLAGADYGQAIDLLRVQQQRLNMSGRLNLALAYILHERTDQARVLLNTYLTKNKTEQIITQFEAVRDRISQGHPVATEIAALTQAPIRLVEGE
ncbi:bacteriophage N4 receptor, outer membrane subunit [Vibrio aerogenes CECT 7868]|uniref:Bacteriophage N4 receptor, outer membrane subunit n=1 Tax=Vibrio aerogenes CECT 7868 TaxID=1216006 RepID=A0A1M5ZST5_9VIBR|nr:tetratricopeptide repeat protein [Vibrio aerogenes]SHI27282.1 bacteriophage N4 receptor, outer membrane subunit [Vibrio aerogenes CECT 7868]